MNTELEAENAALVEAIDDTRSDEWRSHWQKKYVQLVEVATAVAYEPIPDLSDPDFVLVLKTDLAALKAALLQSEE